MATAVAVGPPSSPGGAPFRTGLTPTGEERPSPLMMAAGGGAPSVEGATAMPQGGGAPQSVLTTAVQAPSTTP